MQRTNVLIAFVVFNAIFWVCEIKLDLLKTIDLKSVELYSKIVSYRQVKPEVDPRCPTEPIIVAELVDFNLEIMIWDYAGTWGLSKHLNRTAYMYQDEITKLQLVFPNIPMLPLQEIEHCNLSLVRIQEDSEPIETLEYRTNGSNLLFASKYILPGAVVPFFEEAKVAFKFDDSILDEVSATKTEIKGDGRTIVAVNVRRLHTVYDYYLMNPVNVTYYLDAMDWFRQNIGGNLLFAIISDDAEWSTENLLAHVDVVLATKNTNHDLAFLSLADHLITDFGKLGSWASMMNEGQIIALMPFATEDILARYKKYLVFDESKYTFRFQ